MSLILENVVTAFISSGAIVSLVLYYLKIRKIPVLILEKFTKTNDELNPIYFVRVRNTKGEGKAINCSGRIDIGNSHSQTVWASESINSEILHDSYEDLRLFRIENIEKSLSSINKILVPKSIWIPTLKPEHLRKDRKPYTESEKLFEDYRDKEITIHVDADRGKSISLTKKISEIIDEAIVEKT